MNWKMVVALVLFLPIWWWIGLPPLWSAGELAKHYAESLDDEHCNEVVMHPKSLVDRPAVSADLDVTFDAFIPHERLLALLSPPHLARDHPPSLFYSLSHSLRAPPALIPA